MNREELLNILSNKYTRKNWLELIKNISSEPTFFKNPNKLELDKNTAKQGFELGSFETTDGMLIGLFEVELVDNKQIERNRVGLRNLLRKYYRQVDGCFAVYYMSNKWRFSYISETSAKDGNGNRIDSKTEPKRFTYVLGHGETVRTAVDRFDSLFRSNNNLDDIKDAFSVEKLNKEFFKKYKDFYEQFCKYLVEKPSYRRLLAGNKEEDKDKQEKPIRDFIKKLLGRIVFLHFLQKKCWMGVSKDVKVWQGGDTKFMQNLFARSNDKEHFHSNELRTLFFETLNKKRKDDISPTKLGKDIKIPYLNGGLFDKDISYDNDIDFPQDYFTKLLDFFVQYNFTIDESDTIEQEVGIDPEMLGHIFENLLEENRQKGAFYTPKEIVSFMCQETLIEYLCTHLCHSQDSGDLYISVAIEKLIRSHDKGDENDRSNPILKNAKRIDKLLDDVKICDPAIGSGAFPIGLLHEILKVKTLLDWTLDRAKAKKHIIQNSIYGVDIDSGAVDIARLRFWLALVLDEDEPQTLPNLDYKIMEGDSIVGLPEQFLIDTKAEKIIESYKNLFFDESDLDKKNEIKKAINEATINLFSTAKNFSFDLKFDYRVFFSEVFHNHGGFDIVIGNPPYIQIQKFSGQEIQDTWKNQGYYSFTKTGDVYCLFYEKGARILKDGGSLCYITSNKWMKSSYGEKLRAYFCERTNPKILIDFGGYQIFENASVDTNIFIFKKEKFTKQFFATRFGKEFNKSLSIRNYFADYKIKLNDISSKEWHISVVDDFNIIERIKKRNKTLKNLGLNIYRGLISGFSQAFVIDEQKKKELCKLDSKNEELIKPLLRGRNIRQYRYEWDYKYLITIPSGWTKDKVFMDDEIKYFKNNYKILYEYLYNAGIETEGKGKGLFDRLDQGEHWWELRPCAYYNEFEKDKIVYPDISDESSFTLVPSGIYFNNTVYMISTSRKDYLGILNSKFVNWFYRHIANSLGSDTVRYFTQYVEQVPLPDIGSISRSRIETLVDKILTAKKQNLNANTKEMQDKIDTIVYKLYELTYDEVKIVDPEIEKIISREEYEKFEIA